MPDSGIEFNPESAYALTESHLGFRGGRVPTATEWRAMAAMSDTEHGARTSHNEAEEHVLSFELRSRTEHRARAALDLRAPLVQVVRAHLNSIEEAASGSVALSSSPHSSLLELLELLESWSDLHDSTVKTTVSGLLNRLVHAVAEGGGQQPPAAPHARGALRQSRRRRGSRGVAESARACTYHSS